MPMIHLGSADCQCIMPPCPCDMKVVYSESDCPVGTQAEVIPSDLQPGTMSTTEIRYRCVPVSGAGSFPLWLALGAAALGAFLLLGREKEKD